jgi:4-amino-4-deoxy-L-arabinose transferase-like glycosyltransferase
LELLAFWVCALAIAFFLFYRFGDFPTGLFCDETSMGYNGRALDKTLADQDGVTLPLFFRSLDDWKSPILIYAMAVTEAVFGATAVGVRLPSALFMLGMALGLFFLLRSLTGNPRLARWMALLSLLIPSIFFYARIAISEVSCFPCLLVLALLALLRFERLPSWPNAALAGAMLGLCTYAYTTARLLAPLMVAAAAVSFYFDPKTRRHLGAFLGAAALLGAPFGIFMMTHPHTLDRRFEDNAAWAHNPGLGTVVDRIVHTYFQHIGSLDFLFRTGQHSIWFNAGEGLLPIWLWAPLWLGLGSLWQRRESAFARFLMALVVLSPIPVSLTFQQDFPHTSRSLHFVPLAVVLGALAVHDWFLQQRIPRWLPALAIAGALLEGAQDLWLYFGDFAVAQERSLDGVEGAALKIVQANRRGKEEPVYLPQSFFEWSGTHIEFWCDVDPTRRRELGLEGIGFHHANEPTRIPGSIVVTPGSQWPATGAVPLGATPTDHRGPPAWRVYRMEEAPAPMMEQPPK